MSPFVVCAIPAQTEITLNAATTSGTRNDRDSRLATDLHSIEG
jgi:hypothetical protein